ncbi:MAG: hypothetical protein KY466_12955 [Gemmatimonadetes bacterium]|nr:hypothetical protein [Gemmatimonadota bacterium]
MDIDGTAVAGMIFSLLCLVIIGGTILMYPLTRRLGQLMEQRLEERRTGRGPTEGVDVAELRELKAAVRSLEAEVARLGEKQGFVEGLLESGSRPRELAGP